MPTSYRKYQGEAIRGKESSSVPQSVTVSIALGAQEIDAFHYKNDIPLAPELQQAHTTAGVEASLSSHSNLKTLQTHGVVSTEPLELGKPASAITNNRGDTPQPNNAHHANSTVHRPTNRTKKLAKPTAKAKARSRGRKVATAKRKGTSKPTASSKQTPISKNNEGKSPSATVLKSPPEGDVNPTKNTDRDKSKPKRKQSKISSSHVAPSEKKAKSQTKKLKSEAKKAKQVKKKSLTSSLTGTKPNAAVTFQNSADKGSQILKVVSAVVDTVSDEIRYCASMFAIEQTKMVISGGEGLPKEKPMATAESSHLNNKQALASNSEFCAMSKQGTAMGTEGISHLEQNDACPSEQSCKKYEAISKGGSSYSEMYDTHAVVTAVKRFALEVYYPFLLSAKMNMGNNSPDADRICLSTFLAIREMLTMNAGKLFSLSTLQGPSKNGAMEGKICIACVLANAIVRNTAKRLNSHQLGGQFYADFIQATRNYDNNNDDFQFSLTHADARSLYVDSEGDGLGKEESMLAKVSFDYARARHPLLCSKRLNVNADGEQVRCAENKRSPPTCPVPTACATFHIEIASTSVSNEEVTTEILGSLKQVLRSK